MMKFVKYYYERISECSRKSIVLLIITFLFSSLNGQIEKFEISIQNLAQTAPNKLEFDLYLLDTDPSQKFDYAGSQLGFLLNSLIYQGGNLSAAIDNKNSGLKSTQQFTAKPRVESKLSGYPEKTLIRLEGVNSGIIGTGTIISTASPGTLLTHFIITGTVDFVINTTPDIVFTSSSASSPLYPTKVAAYINKIRTQLTVSPGVNAIVYGNPVLNPLSPPAVFEVTGTGSYCQGMVGLPVGLYDSETGVLYTLYINEVASGLIVEGTGKEISFGNQLKGTYTVSGTNKAGTTIMKGSAVITENPLPQAPVPHSVIQPSCISATGSVIFNNLPALGTWTLTCYPGETKTSGSGTNAILSGLLPGTYSYTVTDMHGCSSALSDKITINDPPPVPGVPVVIVDCSPGSKKAIVTVKSPLGEGLEYSLDDGSYQPGTSFTGVINGTHTVKVRNSFGCVTAGLPFVVECSCINPPTVTLGSDKGMVCETTIITVSNNSFGGSATSVTLSANGGGNIIPASTSTTPFDFVYQPVAADIGKIIQITVITDNPEGSPCASASVVFHLTVSANPSVPLIGSITQPSCNLPTGSVIINRLPSEGTWELIRNPGNIKTVGTGISTTVAGLNPGAYSFKVTNSSGCTSGNSANVVINQQPATPAAPKIGIITQPTCAVSTGSATLNGLPAAGQWTVTANPGGITKKGSGISTTVSNLVPDTYTFTVANAEGCLSQQSAPAVIQAQPPIPTPPVIGTISPPTCAVSTGSVILSALPSTGKWVLTRYPGAVTTNGTGVTITLSGLPAGTYNYTVTNEPGCKSLLSADVVIPVQPPTPSPPVIGSITHPTILVPTGSVLLTGLPSTGTWKLTRIPDLVSITGTGTSKLVSGLLPGTYSFTVTNSSGCISASSASVVINPQPKPPKLVITDPPTICSTQTADLTRPEITAGSDPNLVFTYWYDEEAKKPLNDPASVPQGKYYIKGTTSNGFFTIKPVTVKADQMPVAGAGEDIVLEYVFGTKLDAEIPEYGIGEWSVSAGGGKLSDANDPKATVTGLSLNQNIFLWSVTNGVCPPAKDYIIITVNDLLIPSLITPDMDGKNDYFVLRGIETLGKTEIIIFDRRGAKVYWTKNYNNDWFGIDYNGRPLPDDTYFYVIRSSNGKSLSGFVVLRR